MGKIRVKTLCIEELEKEQTEKVQRRKEGKKARKTAKGAHGGERVVSMAPAEEELENIEIEQEKVSQPKAGPPLAEKVSKAKARLTHQRSKRYQTAIVKVDRTRRYPLTEAISLLKEIGSNNKSNNSEN